MRQGLSATIFLLLIVLFGPFAQAIEMTQSEVSSWLNNPNAQSSADHIYQLALQDKVPEIQESLEGIPLPKQEVVRYLLLKKIEDTRLVLSPRLAIFIQSQQTQQPRYQVVESGDGYRVTLPAFNASLVATRLLNGWEQDQTTIGFIIGAENKQIQLATWLHGDAYHVQQKEALFLKEADSLSLQALQYFSNQLVGNSVVKWLPSTSIVIKLAQLTDDERLYSLLWKMKANDKSIKELQRLAQVGDEFSLQQVMNATQNPTMKLIAINHLVAVKPMTGKVQRFLVEKLSHGRDSLMVAQALSATEHHDWLISLLQSGQINHSQTLLNSLIVAK